MGSSKIQSALKDLTVPIGSLRPYARNPRRGDVGLIAESLERNGQYRPLVVNRPTGEVLAGNHTLLAARQLGWSEIAVTYVDVNDAQAQRIVLVDNRASDVAGYDDELLAELLKELPDLEGSGWDAHALDELLEEIGDSSPGEADVPPPPPGEPRTAPGDRYTLGRHRLLCGDAREEDAYSRVLGGKQAAIAWTDPPYGVDYEGRTPGRLRIEGDGAEGVEALLRRAFAQIDAALAPGAPLYVAHPSGHLSLVFGSAFVGQGWRLHQTLVWVKDTFVLGHADYHFQHESILFGYKAGDGRLGRGGARWFGDNAQSSVLSIARPRAAREHPTMKPPELVERALLNSSPRRALVLDPFAGSGSTLVACERTGRRARLIELDPRFGDVIVERFERLTGRRAKRVRA